MAGFNAKALANKVRNGNTVSILVGDQIIGFGQGLQHSIDFGAEGIYGIGNAKPQEIQQLRTSVTLTLDSMALTEEGISYFGYSASWESILAGNQLILHWTDYEGNTLLTFDECVASNFSSNLQANQPVTQSTSFIAMDVLDADGDSLLNVAPGSVTTGASTLVTDVLSTTT